MIAHGNEPGAFSRDFVADLEQADSVDAAMDVLEDKLSKLGFPIVDYAYVRSPLLPNGRWMPPTLKTRNFPRGFSAHWSRYETHDPYYHASFNRRSLIRWMDVQNQPSLTLDQQDCCKYLSDQGMHCGITIPMHMYDGTFAFMSILGESESRNWYSSIEKHELPLVHLAHYFNNTLLSKFSRGWRSSSQSSLSTRESECLTWAAKGKTSVEIAIILGLSVETVRVYTKRACRRLNAVNRTHAIAKALHLGIVDL